MKMKSLFYLLFSAVALTACNSTAQEVKNLKADEFYNALQHKNIQLIDVRTPEEYAEKHIAGATNIDWNGKKFDSQMSSLDKSKPLYLYCLSGGRSSSAANWAVKNGFTEVYNLKGGITAWMSAKKPVEAPGGKALAGMSFDDYLTQIKSDKLVLVDFNAVWCGPCKILTPIVNKVIANHADKVQLLSIDVDKNSAVATTMNVEGIPLLLLYKDGKEVWRHMGLTDEADLTDQITQFSNK